MDPSGRPFIHSSKRIVYGLTIYIEERGGDGVPFDLSALRAAVRDRQTAKRFLHTCGVEQEADTLAMRWGVDRERARFSAILHDAPKRLSDSEQRTLCEKYKIPLPADGNMKLVHAETGAMLARREFGCPEEICCAIRCHTLGKENMTALEKVIYLADWIEPNRSMGGVYKLREMCYVHLEAALLLAFDMSVCLQMVRGRTIHRQTLEARNYLLT